VSYPFISPEMIHQGLVLLVGVAGTVALDVIKDVVKERVTGPEPSTVLCP
jgi:hypothetical protein